MAGEKPCVIRVNDYDEETGIMDFEVDDAGKEKLIQLGIIYVMMLGVLEIDEDDVFKILQDYAEKRETKENLEQSYEYWHEGSPV